MQEVKSYMKKTFKAAEVKNKKDLNKWKDKSAFNEGIKEHLREKRCLIPTEFEVPIIYI